MTSTDFIQDCRDTMTNAGLVPPANLITDGTLNRCGTVGKEFGQDGSYVVHLDNGVPTLWFENHRTGISDTFTAKTKSSMTPTEYKAYADRMATMKEQRKQEQEAQYAKAAQEAQSIWNIASIASNDYPYLVRKGVPSYGLRMATDGRLHIPVMNEQGRVQSLQYIAPDGGKRFLTGGKKANGFFHITAKNGSKDGPLCVCEGFATAASVHMATGHACLVSFDAGNLLPVATMARERYPERTIILCADNDVKGDAPNIGIDKATAAAKTINGLIAVPPAHEGKPTDFNDLHQWRGLEAVRTCVDNALPVENVAEGENEKPIPLRRPPQEQRAYPVKALGPFADAVEAFASGIKVPLPMAAASVLSALACGTQGIANVATKDGRLVPTSLFILTIADSGDRKSALDRAVLHGIYGIEKQNYVQYQDERQRFETARTAWETLPKKEREANPFTMQEPHNPSMVMENVNAEGAFRQLKEGRPSVIFSSDEGGTFFGGQAFQKEHVLKTITFFSNLWDGKPVDKVRAGEGASRLYDRRASMHMMLQPHIAQSVLSDEMMQNQGFLPRFLISYPQSLKGTRFYDGENVRNNMHVRKFYQVCESLLQTPLRIDEGTNGLILDTICLSEDAHVLWVDHHDHVERMLNPDGVLNLVSAYASKNAEQVLRIAGVLTLAENQGARVISASTMANAITLAQWYLREALRLREEGTTSPDILEAEKLLQWIERRGEKYISSSLVKNWGPNVLRDKKKAESAIKTLEEHGHLRKGQGSVDIRGVATQTFWEVVA